MKARTMWKFLCLCLLCYPLMACFVPHKYYATLTLTNDSYHFDFIGEMYMAALFTAKVQDPSVDKEMASEQIFSEFKRVIHERKPQRFEIRKTSPVSFQTRFTYTSPYTYPEASGLFNFTIQGDTLTVTSRHISSEEHELLQKNTIPSQGTLCIKTYGKILENSAPQPANVLQQCSTWHMENLDESIKMVIRFPKSLDVN